MNKRSVVGEIDKQEGQKDFVELREVPPVYGIGSGRNMDSETGVNIVLGVTVTNG